MIPTDRDLAVAQAVWNLCREGRDNIEANVTEVDIREAIAAIPDQTPLLAPTGPGWWWGRFSSFDCPAGPWKIVEIYKIGEGLRCIGEDIDDFDAWVGPLTPPGGEA